MRKKNRKLAVPLFLFSVAVLLIATSFFKGQIDLSKNKAFLINNSILERTGKILMQIIKTDREVSASEKKFPKPEIIKSVYLTGWSASSQSKINYVYDLVEGSGVNAVVIDIKD